MAAGSGHLGNGIHGHPPCLGCGKGGETLEEAAKTDQDPAASLAA
ncbi:hypothetical protein [Paracoccus lichenicola]|nr:hypothetical protein [Paracoccus lichenicola]